MTRILIGLHGLAEVGKTTAAKQLCQELHLQRYIIAEPITRACAAALGIKHQQFLEIGKRKVIDPLGITKREMMQGMGDYMISNNPNALINLLEHRMALMERYINILNGDLVEDVRTEREAEWLRQRGGQLIHIRNHRVRKANNHRTERGIAVAEQDRVIHNTGTLRDFNDKLHYHAKLLRTDFQLRDEAI